MKRTVSSLRPLGARSISMSVTKPYLYFSPSSATFSLVSRAAAIMRLTRPRAMTRAQDLRGRERRIDVRFGRVPAEADAQARSAPALRDTPIASSTCDGCTLPDEQAAPELTITPSRSSAMTRGLGGNAGQREVRRVWQARRVLRRRSTASGTIAAARLRSGRADRRSPIAVARAPPRRRSPRCRRRSPCRRDGRAPARRRATVRERRAVPHDQRADALRAADLVRREREIIASPVERDLAGRLHRIDKQQRVDVP